MPMEMHYRLANKYEVEIPFTADIYTIIDSFMDELSLDAKKEILSQYGDAGKASSFVFISREKTPPIQEAFPKARTLLDVEAESELWENYPYVDEVEADHTTRTLKVRFHYLLGSVPYIDETSGAPKEHRRYWNGVVVYRPQSKILEVRTKFRSMGRKMAAKIPAYLGIEPFVPLNLIDAALNRRFVDWISSLNSATIELSTADVASGSLIITARKGMDLRTAKRYHDELRHGRLRHGHVTIKLEDGSKINFHVYFRQCHAKFTLFANEAHIEYVINALEKISEEYRFEKPERILSEYFGKET